MKEKNIMASFEISGPNTLRLKSGEYFCDRSLINYVQSICLKDDLEITQLLVEDCSFIIPCDMRGFGCGDRHAFVDLDSFQEMRIKVTLNNCIVKSYLHDITIKA